MNTLFSIISVKFQDFSHKTRKNRNSLFEAFPKLTRTEGSQFSEEAHSDVKFPVFTWRDALFFLEFLAEILCV